eukprot:gb/GECG01007466.1/.p1 GENE.gb/GECG01007466.1/~~gb/GECG01007466.1/.p1  ORF type:complete len:264 (+),score=34.92 gb/GECG01007466.1/:1-792(+)
MRTGGISSLPKAIGMVCLALLLIQQHAVSRVTASKSVKLDNIPGKEYGGFKFGIASGESSYGSAGAQPLGDVNGDGIDDFMSIKYRLGNENQDSYMAAEVFLGKPSPFPKALLVDRDEDWYIFAKSSTYGESLGLLQLGDVNGDGLNDVMMTAVSLASGQTTDSYAYVVFGSKEKKRRVDVSALDGINGFSIKIPDNGGAAAIGCGDFNKDGINDIVAIRKAYYNGESYMVFGKKNRNEAVIDVTQLNGDNGFKIGDISYPFF